MLRSGQSDLTAVF